MLRSASSCLQRPTRISSEASTCLRALSKCALPCLQVVKGPVTKHLPVGAERLGFTRAAQGMAKIPGFVDELRWSAGPPVLVLGAMAHGQLDITYVDRWDVSPCSMWPASGCNALVALGDMQLLQPCNKLLQAPHSVLVCRWIAVSEYPLSAATAISRVTNSLELRWQIT